MVDFENVIYDYLNGFYNKRERELLETNKNFYSKNSDFDISITKNWENIENLYKALLLSNNVSNYHLKVSFTGSDLIEKIFNKHVDIENTFVISTTFEHPFVTDKLKEIKNTYLFNMYEIKHMILANLLDKLDKIKFKNILVYIPGIAKCTGEIIPQEFFSELKAQLNRFGVKCIFVLDDVHGMFLMRRNYEIFDYILYTCHSYISGFDMGMLFTKNECGFGYTNIKRALLYYNKLLIVLNKQEKLKKFNDLLSEYFTDIIDYENFSVYDNLAPHIFGMDIKNIKLKNTQINELRKKNICVSDTSNFISIELFDFVNKDAKEFIDSLNLCKQILIKAKLRKELSE